MNINLFRAISFLLLIALVAVIYFLTVQNITAVWVLALVIPALLFLQASLVKCKKCGTRPGLRLLIIWTILLDFELYIADTLFLRKCPTCGQNLKEQNKLATPNHLAAVGQRDPGGSALDTRQK